MSNKTVFYKQCRMSKKIPTGEVHSTSWIPEKFAVMGKVIKLKDENGKWDNGWVVEGVGARLSEEYLPDSHQSIKGLRKATGDSLPKVKT